jgi:predicted chitinase
VLPAVSPAPAGRRVTVTAPLLRRGMPGVGQARSVEYAPFLQQAMEEFAIDTPPRAAAFLAQLAHESGQLRFMEEIWGPTSAQRRYEPPTSLAARLGNTQPGDGKRFKGRGPIQLTGRANYCVFGDALALDLIANPALAASKEVAFRIAGLYWKKRGLNPLADRQDFRRITRLINGGFNGLADRLRFWEQAKQLFDVRRLPAGAMRAMRRPGAAAEEAPDPRFRRGLDAPGEVTPTAVERSAAVRGLRAPAKRTAPPRPAVTKKPGTRRTVRSAAAKTKPARATARRGVPKKQSTGAKMKTTAKTKTKTAKTSTRARTRRTARPRAKIR